MKYEMINDGKETFAMIEGGKVILKDNDIEKINLGYIYSNGSFIETEDTKKNSLNNKIEIIKARCSEDILNKYPSYSQANTTANVARINALCLRESRGASLVEDEILDLGNEMFLWIENRRKECYIEMESILT